MWSLLGRKTQLLIIIGSGILIAWAYNGAEVLFTGQVPSLFRQISFAVAIVGGILVVAADSLWPWIWRNIPFLQTQIFPDLNGTWIGTLLSNWIDPATGQPKPPIPIEITIRQKLFGTHVSLKTGESRSYSTRAFLEAFKDTRRYRVWYSYNNDPLAQVQHRSSQHEGVAYLELHFDESQHRLVGKYYTARNTSGDIDVRRAGTRRGHK